MAKLQRVRGTRDMLSEECQIFRKIEETALKISSLCGFTEIDTPIFEATEVFHRTLGETSDVIHKETYTFTDRSGDSLTLRPEGTAGIARAFISEGMQQNLPLKFYYSGPMFRHERPQKGRYRQFHQIGVEVLGMDSPLADVEVIELAYNLLNEIKLEGQFQLEINTLGDQTSRENYRTALVNYLSQFKDQLSPDSQMRLDKNPLRILDSKSEGDQKIIQGAPRLEDSLTPEAKKFFGDVSEGLKKLGIAYTVNPRLVRGLDYYSHTVFEFTTTALGAQGTLLAGGRYDGLISMMGGPQTPGVGWAAGIERLAELASSKLVTEPQTLITVIGADAASEMKGLEFAQSLRKKGFMCESILSGNIGKKLKRANKLQAKWALIIGESEMASQTISCKNLLTGEQKTISWTEFEQTSQW